MIGRIVFFGKQKLLAADAAQIINIVTLGYNPQADERYGKVGRFTAGMAQSSGPVDSG
jgi:hypothetical protein